MTLILARSEADWQHYFRWNDAILQVVYPELDETVPVYLDLDEESLAQIGELVGHDGDPKHGLCEAVSRVVVEGSQFTLAGIVQAHNDWMRSLRRSEASKKGAHESQPLRNPPAVAFLAMATLAALEMGTDDLISIAYYPRVADLVKLPRDEGTIQSQFHRHSERLWRELNTWIERQEGRVGLPTAYSLTKRFVGIPLSQALVRKTDRQKLPGFFAQYGLDPGSEMSSETLLVFLDAWFKSETCSASDALKRLWSTSTTHDRIAEIVSLELSGWDGTLPKDQKIEGNSAGQVRLLANIQQGFMGERFSLALTYRHLGSSVMAGTVEIETEHGHWIPLMFQPLAGNLWRTSSSHGLNIVSVLEGSAHLRVPGDIDASARRYPRAVVPLVLDEIHGGYVEQSAIQLNVESIVLVRDNGDSLAQVRKVLESYARPGFREKPFDELPDGWVAFVGVQLFGVPPSSLTRFKELQPISRNQMTIGGGVRIPSSVRKWTYLAPPEIRVAVDGNTEFAVVLTDQFDGNEIIREASNNGAHIVDLSALNLASGDYRASVYLNGSRDPAYQSTIRLRSADEVDSNWHLVDRLTYQMDERLNSKGAISAQKEATIDSVTHVDGAFASESFNLESSLTVSNRPQWVSWPESTPKLRASVSLTPVGPDSCLYTGAHREHIEVINDKTQRGECRNCHIVKYYPIWPKKKKYSANPSSAPRVATHLDVEKLANLSVNVSSPWDAALDALRHLGGGKGGVINSLAAQIDSDAIFAYNFSHLFEQLGHIDIERESDGSIVNWEIAPTCLAQTTSNEWNLVGYWTTMMVEEIQKYVESLGGALGKVSAQFQPTRHFLKDVTEEDLLENPVATVVGMSGKRMLQALPQISSIGEVMQRVSMPGFSRAERLDLSSLTWVETGDVSQPGAYRLKRDFRSIYVFRTEIDVQNQAATIGSPYLVKYLAANLHKESILLYREESGSIIVPFGTELPGLYSRALVLMSGERPRDVRVSNSSGKRNCKEYRNIDKVSANLLQTLLLT